MLPTEEVQIVSRVMSVILRRRMEQRWRKRQRHVPSIVDRIDTLGFRVITMPVGPSVETTVSGLGRNMYEEVRVLILARGDNQDWFCINLPGPSFRSIKLHVVDDQLVL